ncbi:MAG TPA: DUF6152 family protein, partial [Bryobacteraceae bacterium]|nr:DUF6152 family protein [Bryobacteraceae bacterium]
MQLRRAKHALTAILFGFVFAAVPLAAHHALAAEYNVNQPITLKGTVTKVAWSNPHVRLYIEEKGQSRPAARWDLEMASPNLLFLHGWKIDTLRPGDH